MSLREISRALLDGAISPSERHPFSPRFEAERVADGTLFVSSFANVAAFETSDGLVAIDTGSFFLAEPTRVLLRRLSQAPLHTAVFTHGHVDHCFGVERYESEEGARRVHVVAHEALPARFDRYKLTRGYNGAINARQFQVADMFPDTFRYPDQTYRDALTLSCGGRRFELHHALGETDDHTWVWAADAGVLCTGDLFIWASPNCGNPQKVQRYPREWAVALRAMAKLDAEVLCPGHGVPIFGASDVRRALEETAELLETLVEQTLAWMNRGATLDRILQEVKAPPRLLERPYLSPIYDEPEFIVRNLFRLYGGWYDGNPAHLKPAPEARLAAELASLAGGARKLSARAVSLAAAGERRLACHLIELAVQAAPDDAEVHRLRQQIYEERAAAETSLMAKGVFAGAARESAERGD
ncbi:MAG: MBL fold metallo-hydrolase [Polyangiaceae bacterium]|jgi:alkyl sulfatase BDS1-like metallo-beta-lactamase superfamily hydrolase|nr:MBL fold metallo-hydrolase [Polyangiaceae bacterium]MBK8938510.1 MBL fold metallo-hydrolase [Polyangiaceae bacterium]